MKTGKVHSLFQLRWISRIVKLLVHLMYQMTNKVNSYSRKYTHRRYIWQKQRTRSWIYTGLQMDVNNLSDVTQGGQMLSLFNKGYHDPIIVITTVNIGWRLAMRIHNTAHHETMTLGWIYDGPTSGASSTQLMFNKSCLMGKLCNKLNEAMSIRICQGTSLQCWPLINPTLF